MTDFADEASDLSERQLADALQVRKPVPDRCECGKPVHILRNGAHCVACKGCLASRIAGDLDAL